MVSVYIFGVFRSRSLFGAGCRDPVRRRKRLQRSDDVGRVFFFFFFKVRPRRGQGFGALTQILRSVRQPSHGIGFLLRSRRSRIDSALSVINAFFDISLET